MEKKKKRILISSIIVGVIVVAMLLSSTIFKIRSVSYEYQTTLTCLSKEELFAMIEEADFPIGKSIFFARFDDNITKMEKEHPYAKINGIERKFPSYLVVYISERVPVVRFESNGSILVLDADLKVLNKVVTASEYHSASGEADLPKITIGEIPAFSVSTSGVQQGDFLNSEQMRSWVNAFYEGAVCPSPLDPLGVSAISCIKMIKSISVGYVAEIGKPEFNITYNDYNLTTRILGDETLADDIYKVISTINSVEAGKSPDEVFARIDVSGGVVYAERI